MKRILCLLLALITAATILAGCAGKAASAGKKEDDGRISISLYAWDRSMLKELTP